MMIIIIIIISGSKSPIMALDGTLRYSVIVQIVSRQHSTGVCGRRVVIEPCTHFPRTHYACSSLFFCRRMG